MAQIKIIVGLLNFNRCQNIEYFLLLYLCETEDYNYLADLLREEKAIIHVIVLAQWRTQRQFSKCPFVMKFDKCSKTEWILCEVFKKSTEFLKETSKVPLIKLQILIYFYIILMKSSSLHIVNVKFN